jgi:subtilisin family serine protease
MVTDVEYLVSCPACTQVGWLEGYVYDYDNVSLPCQDATVHVEPGNRDVPVDATGYYTVALVPFGYDVIASAVGYPEPDGPYRATILDGGVSSQDLVLRRPDIAVDPMALSASAMAAGTATRYLTITNGGTYALEVLIRDVAPTVLNALSVPQAVPAGDVKSRPPTDSVEIEVEPQLLAQVDAEGASGYMIYFRQQPDLSPAFQMDWSRRGRFVVRSLQAASERSQARVRAYLDAQGIDYAAFWIDNVIVVESSSRDTLNGLLSYSEVEALRARRTVGLIEPEEFDISHVAPMAVEANISHVQADQVWDEGVTGEGIVVANIDTGVRYTHAALNGQYRGNLGGGSYGHNHNWWDPYGDHPVSPADDHSHGSHTMGIMIGDDGGANRIGMAPGAQWIACRGCSNSSCTDAALLECAQFVAAPWDLSGPGTADPDMRPHVVNNSWGDCGQTYDGWYQDVVDAWHAAGIYPIFSNGNASNCGYSEPPGLNTVGNPARYGNVTGVGSAGQSDGRYASHSNWGPTDNPDTVNPRGYPNLKPQVVAPGVSIRSSVNWGDSAYTSYGGTSMSAPHVAGLVALMWQGAPCLVGDYATTETLIEQTSTPIPYASGNGDEGPGNVPNHATGWGEINALAAVHAARDFCRTDWLPWVETDVVTATVGAGDEQVVEVTFSCDVTATQQTQPLEGALRLAHSDPCEASVDIALTCFCIGRDPLPSWEKEVWINGEEASSVAGPHIVRPGDAVTVVDYVGATYSETIASTLTETWGGFLELVGYDAGGVGTVVVGDNVLVWSLVDVAPNTLYPITKTFEVQHGDWRVDRITESYTVEGALNQGDDIVVVFEQYLSAVSLDKRGPATADSDYAIPLTLLISSDGGFRGDAVFTDTLPPGMAYAGNLTYTYGRAWEDDNVVYWTNDTATVALPDAPAPPDVLILTPDVGSGGDVAALRDALGTCGVNVTTWDANANGEPGVADLLAYDVVVIGNSVRWNNMDKATVGNNLADYIDRGGKVIEGLYVQSFDVWGLAGRYMAEGYSPFTPATLDHWSSDTMRIANPGHPVMAGVTSVSDNWGHQNPGLGAGAELIANWTTSDYNYVVANDNVVALNQLLHHNADWTGDVPLILCNSIDHLMFYALPPLPARVTISFDVRVPDVGEICNQAHLDWGWDHTSGEHCVEVISVEKSYFYLPLMLRGR